MNQLVNAQKYRLPTEAEWEYACRAGTKTAYSFGDDPRLLDLYGWHIGNSNKRIHQVKMLKPNAWGLYDMHGNVLEWCEDWYGKYDFESINDPTGPLYGRKKVLRGGAWCYSRKLARSNARLCSEPTSKDDDCGFRCVRTEFVRLSEILKRKFYDIK